ncbi:glycosyltransferase [Desulfonema magnum]|uniref:Glycosyl transferase, family I n=1 Tax=Desulfonema magnum TaxID=45655 RepID=A0A975BG18_9BACT|nr:glycosyltransferase [Desulfonema magnum]QTA84832.1 Glycosyl transferase, family I [Desulfonema magnum]
MLKNKKLWIAWEDDGSIRSKVLSREMKADFHTFTLFEGHKHLSVFRYPVAVLQTFFTLVKEKPEILVVQNPSIVLSFFAALVKPVFHYKLVTDLHTLYLNPRGFKKIIMNFLNDYSLKRSNITIVTNESYRAKIKDKTKKVIFVLPDRIPDFDYEFEKISLKGKNNVLFICTFSEDEPWEEVIDAAKLLEKDTYIHISGRNDLNKDNIPPNVILTGFLPTRDYQNLLRSVDIIMVLTHQEDCLVCGGYEAVSAEKPLILSRTRILREYFNSGTVFTKNISKDIAESVRLAIKNKPDLKKQIKELKSIRMSEWEKRWGNLLRLL